jgi:2-haloacid dehalogenase
VKRRDLLALAVLGAAAPAQPAGPPRYRAVVFDAFPILDPRPAFRAVTAMVPSRSTELLDAWRSRQFEYQWLRALAGRYDDFERVTEDALVFAARSVGVPVTAEHKRALLQSYLELAVWPDVAEGLAALKRRGLGIAVLSNATPRILDAGMANSGLTRAFDALLSTDGIATFKPDPRAYRLATRALRVAPQDALFVASAAWDAAGAKWCGHPTFWLNRLAAPAEELGVAIDGTGAAMSDLVRFIELTDGGRALGTEHLDG